MHTVVFDEFKILSIKNFYIPKFYESYKIHKILDRDFREDRKENHTRGYNFPVITKDKFFDNLYYEFLVASKNIFGDDLLVSKSNKNTCWCYRSNKKDFVESWHDHAKTATINSVYYFDIGGGGSISFVKNYKKFTYSPDKNELLIFPGNLMHKPDRPRTRKNRYTINLELQTVQSSLYLFGLV